MIRTTIAIVGQCPSGLSRERQLLRTDERQGARAVLKQGQCPSNWMQSGSYCVEMRRR
jgi:hypothetical protein